MSKSNSGIKVLKTAHKRVTKGWIKGAWHSEMGGKHYVCLEGAIFGFCQLRECELSDAQKEAKLVIESLLFERRGERSIPAFNDDHETTQEDVLEIIKLGIIRLESGWPDDDYISEEETASLL